MIVGLLWLFGRPLAWIANTAAFLVRRTATPQALILFPTVLILAYSFAGDAGVDQVEEQAESADAVPPESYLRPTVVKRATLPRVGLGDLSIASLSIGEGSDKRRIAIWRFERYQAIRRERLPEGDSEDSIFLRYGHLIGADRRMISSGALPPGVSWHEGESTTPPQYEVGSHEQAMLDIWRYCRFHQIKRDLIARGMSFNDIATIYSHLLSNDLELASGPVLPLLVTAMEAEAIP